MKLKPIFFVVILLSISLLSSAFLPAASAETGADSFELIYQDGRLTWMTGWENAGTLLSLAFPDGDVVDQYFEPGAVPYFILAENGEKTTEGLYQFRLVGIPAIDDGAREAGGLESEFPADLQIWTGRFTVENGMVSMPGDETGTDDNDPDGMAKDVVYADDLIVDGSICTGFDCVNGEVFDYDTLVLKENNLRIFFNDTSISGSFPSSDWRIVINDSINGGQNYFAIEDAAVGYTPFKLEAGSRNHALYLDASGELALGSNLPEQDLHIFQGNTPTIRLDQDGSGGWQPYEWDIAGNEANFFVRDVTNGNNLVFRIQDGAPGDSLTVKDTGYVGIGTWNPEAALHVMGNVVVDGYLTERSDVNAKENFKLVNSAEVLAKLDEIEIMTWTYKDDNESVQHIGPMAQDFYAAYQVGKDDKHLAALDVNGVALAAIQALSAENEAKNSELAALEAQVDDLESRLNRLEKAESGISGGAGLAAPFLFGVLGMLAGALIFSRRK